jgi:hypothetical protein
LNLTAPDFPGSTVKYLHVKSGTLFCYGDNTDNTIDLFQSVDGANSWSKRIVRFHFSTFAFLDANEGISNIGIAGRLVDQQGQSKAQDKCKIRGIND